MKTKNLTTGLLCLFVMAVFFTISTKSQKTEETPKFETILIGTGGDPHWSLDGTKLAYMYKGSLYIANADGAGERLKVAELPKWMWGFIWVDSTEFILNEFERHRIKGKGKEEFIRIKKLTIDGKIEPLREVQIHRGDPMITPPMVLNDGTVGYYEIPNLQGKILDAEKTFKIIKEGKLPPDSAVKQVRTVGHAYPDTGIWLEEIGGTVKKKVTNRPFSGSQLSPDGSKILAVNSHGPDYGLFVLNLNGEVLAYLGGGVEDSVELTPGVFGWLVGSRARWSPDNTRIVCMFSAEDDKTVVATDLFLVNADGTGRIRLTNTPEIIEASPSWSPDGTRIAYTDYKTSRLFVMKVK